jgi:hypothetical protein
MLRSKFRWLLFWIAIAYIAVTASVLYPALHEGFGIRISLWNCVPPTIGLILVITALGRSKSRIVGSASFALLTAVAAMFLFAAWFFTPLDTDPHSVTTKFVFVFGPLFSLALALIASAIGWVVGKTRS